MKCPKCNTDLVATKRHGVDVELCQTCEGMWLSAEELNQLEDEVFDFGDEEKGTIAFNATPTELPCPQCGKKLKTFDYRFYDLQMDVCEDGHGYWLDKDGDSRVLELMKEEEDSFERKEIAENQFSRHFLAMKTGKFFDKVRAYII
jgi:Zn-finger nucleic acid-binding protein